MIEYLRKWDPVAFSSKIVQSVWSLDPYLCFSFQILFEKWKFIFPYTVILRKILTVDLDKIC